MSTADQTFIEPVAGSTPSVGLPQRQGRRVVPQSASGAGTDSDHAAVPGSFEPESFPGRNMQLAVLSARRAVVEMRRLLRDHRKDLSMLQCWKDCGLLEAELHDIKSEIDRLSKTNLPLWTRGYLEISA